MYTLNIYLILSRLRYDEKNYLVIFISYSAKF